jgi:hypothetical protein
MRVFLGVLLGVFITIAGAYIYDSMTVGKAVDHNWREFTDRVRHAWNRLVERT